MYVVHNWHRVSILFNLERIVDGGMFNNFIVMIIHFVVIFGGMLEINIANKVVCFGVEGVIIFQGLKTNVIVQLINKYYLFVVRIHYTMHQCNLVVQNLSSLTLVTNIKCFFFFYVHLLQFVLKKTLESTKLVEVIESKDLNF